MKIVLLDQGSLDQNDLDFSGFIALGHEWLTFGATQDDQVLHHAQDAHIIICNKVAISANIMATLPKLQLICIAATGTNNVDLWAAQQAKIAVCNVRDYGSHSVAEHVIMLILALKRNLFHYQQAVIQGDWQRSSHFCLMDTPIGELCGSTVGIIGNGAIGHLVSRLLKALGAEILLAERPGAEIIRPDRTAFSEVLRQSDVISLHCPLTETNQKMISTAEFKQMKSTALLINTARGGLVDEQALLQALQEGEIAGAATDVLSIEPPAQANVLLNHPLNNLIITPHMAWASLPARQRLLDSVLANIQSFLDGELSNSVI